MKEEITVKMIDSRADWYVLDEVVKGLTKTINSMLNTNITIKCDWSDDDEHMIFTVTKEDYDNDVGFFWEKVDKETLDIIKEF